METEQNIVSNLSDKSRSLRKTSVKKRLETELKKVNKRRKEKICKKPRLNKYQRKVANAKERERMKRMNEEYERLKKVVPMEQLNSEDGKDKKVTYIRSNNYIYIIIYLLYYFNLYFYAAKLRSKKLRFS